MAQFYLLGMGAYPRISSQSLKPVSDAIKEGLHNGRCFIAGMF
jgi:hypothetical protein